MLRDRGDAIDALSLELTFRLIGVILSLTLIDVVIYFAARVPAGCYADVNS